jgi:flagellar biosynthesis chaperone FliJ
MILTLNSDNVIREMLEGQRRYREQMASQYSAGYTDAEDAYKRIIDEKDSALADKDSIIRQLQERIAQLEKNNMNN